MLLNFVIPVYNEEENINELIGEIRKYFDFKIIIVDDGSKDSTYEKIAPGEKVIKLKNRRNRGKGYAVKKALSFVDADYVCILDGDVKGIMEEIYTSLDILKNYDCLIYTPTIKKGGFGIVRGFSRYVVKRRAGADLPWCISGMRIVKSEILKKISGKLDNRFGFEVSMTIELIRENCHIKNIEADFKHRVTTRNFKGFYHRGRQFFEIMKYYVVSRK